MLTSGPWKRWCKKSEFTEHHDQLLVTGGSKLLFEFQKGLDSRAHAFGNVLQKAMLLHPIVNVLLSFPKVDATVW